MKIVVLAGGTSTERDVSLNSGKKIYEALRETNHDTVLLDIYVGTEIDNENIFELDYDWTNGIDKIKESTPNLDEIYTKRENKKQYFGPNVIKICQQADIVFLALHGENGENGKVQATFDLLGIKYIGSDYEGSLLAMDKSLTKKVLLSHGIRTPKYIRLNNTFERQDDFTYPKVVKVANGGSSIGVFIVQNDDEYIDAVSKASELGGNILVEEYVKGREFSVGIIDGKALPIIEIIPKEGFYDYKNKYQEGNTIEICPANLSIEKTEEMQSLAERVFKALRLKVYGRIDFLVSDKNEEIFCLEANTLPGMTPMSLIPQEAQAIGMSYIALCEKIIELSLLKR